MDAAQSDSAPSSGTRASRLVIGSALINAALVPAAVLIWISTRSQLVLAQGADSLLDVVVGAILLFSLRFARKPSDENHPFGHQRAEPLGAIVAALLAGALAIEVIHSGGSALIEQRSAHLGGSVVALLGAKLAAKSALLLWLGKGKLSPAANAARVDTRNDIVACASSIVGFALVRAGFPWADAALALPVGIYIGVNGFSLARENLRYLMGAAPQKEVLDELSAAARAVDGVLDVMDMRAQFLGQTLHVNVSILVDGGQTTTRSHDISVNVQKRLEGFEHVSEAFVHVDTEAGIEDH